MGLFDNTTRKTRGNTGGESKMRTDRTATVAALAKAATAEPLPKAVAEAVKLKEGAKAPAFILWPDALDFVKDDGEVSSVKYDATRQYASRFVKANAGWVIVEGKMFDDDHKDDDQAGVLLVKVPAKK